jgi:A/G-specific adenine glycosylase
VGLEVAVRRHLTTVRHAYTHFKIVMEVYECDYRAGRVTLAGPVDFKWIGLDQIKKLAFPKANNKFIPMLRARPR